MGSLFSRDTAVNPEYGDLSFRNDVLQCNRCIVILKDEQDEYNSRPFHLRVLNDRVRGIPLNYRNTPEFDEITNEMTLLKLSVPVPIDCMHVYTNVQ